MDVSVDFWWLLLHVICITLVCQLLCPSLCCQNETVWVVEQMDEVDVAQDMTCRAQRVLWLAGTGRCGCAVVAMVIYMMFFSFWALVYSPFLDAATAMTTLAWCTVYSGTGLVLADCASLICHWIFARKKRYCKRIELCRIPGLAPTDIRVREICGWVCLGILTSVLVGWLLIESEHDRDEVFAELIVYASVILLVLPAALPHMATTLLLQEDLEHLSKKVSQVVDDSCVDFFVVLLEEVSKTKSRWALFLRFHFALGSTAVAFFGFGLLLFERRRVHVSLPITASVITGPRQQPIFWCRFNVWRDSTPTSLSAKNTRKATRCTACSYKTRGNSNFGPWDSPSPMPRSRRWWPLWSSVYAPKSCGIFWQNPEHSHRFTSVSGRFEAPYLAVQTTCPWAKFLSLRAIYVGIAQPGFLQKNQFPVAHLLGITQKRRLRDPQNNVLEEGITHLKYHWQNYIW